ncbi:MAG: recombinase XerC, partial [Comamonadaceae bacterium]|nr:recombinase XerC [Comamonadaceae bacterium]
AGVAGVNLQRVQSNHIRRWVARMHAGGRTVAAASPDLSGAGAAFIPGWPRRLITYNPVLDVRAPKADKPLPGTGRG